MDELPSVAQRFLRYSVYDTQSSEISKTFPSTKKQKVLLKLLVKELQDLGLEDSAMDEHGYVMATLHSNVQTPVPILGLIAHVDTSPDVSGTNVNPQVHPNYGGSSIKLNETQLLTPEKSPSLLHHINDTIITAGGDTLLGADDKAGIAEIMTLLEQLQSDPSIPHGMLRIAFTVDEEIGKGMDFFDVNKFGAKYAYTVDTGTVGNIENETFCADSVTIVFKGVNIHPGYGKDKLASAVKAAARFVDLLPRHLAPESTEGRQGYIHPTSIQGSVEQVTLKLILRDFEENGLMMQRKILNDVLNVLKVDFPNVDSIISIKKTYRNMRLVLEKHPEVVERALEAVSRSGLEPKLTFIRGGTDGARLSYLGVPTPNLFAGGDLVHSRLEWISVEDMEKAVETLVNLVQVWIDKNPQMDD